MRYRHQPCVTPPLLLITVRSHENHNISNHCQLECLFNTLFCLHQRSTLLALCEGNPLLSSRFPHKWPVTWKMFPCHYIVMCIMAYMPWFTNNQCRTIKDIEYQGDIYIVLLEWVLITLMQLLAIVHFRYWWALQYIHGAKYGIVECCYNAVQYNMILHTTLQWLKSNINQNLNPQKHPISRLNRRAMGCL